MPLRTLSNVVFVVLLLLKAPETNARSLKEIQASKTLIVATNGTFAPFSFHKAGKLSGFEIDLVESLAKTMGVTVAWKEIPFDATLIGLNQNRYDLVIASHGVTPERSKIVEFSAPYYCSDAVILTTQNGPTKISQLKGQSLGAQVGTTYLKYLETIPDHGEIKTFRSETDTILALTGGRVKAMVGERLAAQTAIKNRPESRLQIGDTLLREKIAMGIQKGNTTLLEAINTALKKVQSNGEYAQLSKSYFGEDIRCK